MEDVIADLFRRILVPYDFSEPASQALRLAAGLAPPGARLSVLHVVAPLPAGPDVPPWVPTAADVRRARNHLQAVTRKVLMRRPFPLIATWWLVILSRRSWKQPATPARS